MEPASSAASDSGNRSQPYSRSAEVHRAPHRDNSLVPCCGIGVATEHVLANMRTHPVGFELSAPSGLFGFSRASTALVGIRKARSLIDRRFVRRQTPRVLSR